MTLHCGDCLEVMRGMPSGSVDLVVTSPPYNLLATSKGGFFGEKSVENSLWGASNFHKGVGYSEHPDAMDALEYEEWQRDCLFEMMRLITPQGAIFYNHKWRMQDKALNDRSRIVNRFPVRQIVIWDRGSSFNFNGAAFADTYEVIYLIAKPNFSIRKGKRGTPNVWRFPPENGNPHPAPFPVALPQRCIDATDARVVLDPFMGSGTTAIAAIRAGREWIGIEKSEKYCKMAEERIARELMQPALLPAAMDNTE